MPDTFRVHAWQEFKELAHIKKPKCIVYIIAQSIPTRNHTSLKLILPVEGAQYIFTDSAKGLSLRRTGIPVHVDSKGNRFLTDEDVKNFLLSEIEVKDLKVFSYWTA